MSSCSFVEITSVTSKPGKEKGMECNEKLLMKTCVLSAFLYERVRQKLSTPSAGEPVYQVLDNICVIESVPEPAVRVHSTLFFSCSRADERSCGLGGKTGATP